MRKLAQDHLAEIETGRLAAGKAQGEEVKKFAQRMIDDHGRMLQDLQKLASAKGVSLPDAPGAKDRAEMKILERISGTPFDRRYMADMVEDHKKDWKATDAMASQARDPDFQMAADDTKGVIKQHLDLAQQIARSLSARKPTAK